MSLFLSLLLAAMIATPAFADDIPRFQVEPAWPKPDSLPLAVNGLSVRRRAWPASATPPGRCCSVVVCRERTMMLWQKADNAAAYCPLPVARCFAQVYWAAKQ